MGHTDLGVGGWHVGVMPADYPLHLRAEVPDGSRRAAAKGVLAYFSVEDRIFACGWLRPLVFGVLACLVVLRAAGSTPIVPVFLLPSFSAWTSV